MHVQVLRSAQANAVNNHGLDGSRLSVGEHLKFSYLRSSHYPSASGFISCILDAIHECCPWCLLDSSHCLINISDVRRSDTCGSGVSPQEDMASWPW